MVQIQAATQAALIIQSPPNLVADIVPVPPLVEVGQNLHVFMTITNTGQATAEDVSGPFHVAATPAVVTGGNWDACISPKGCPYPFPYINYLQNGGSTTWEWWPFTATATGIACFTGGIVYADANVGPSPTSTLAVSSSQCVQVLAPGSLGLVVTTVSASPQGVFVGDAITVTVTVQNTGTVSLWAVAPTITGLQGSGQATAVSGPSPGGATLAAGQSATYTFTYRASQPGSVSFNVTASGAQGSVYAAALTSNSVTISAALVHVTVYPNPYRSSSAVRGTAKFVGLSQGMTARLYTVRGLEVWKGTSDGSGRAEWDGRNERGEAAAPGTYLWIAEGAGRKERGTLIVE